MQLYNITVISSMDCSCHCCERFNACLSFSKQFRNRELSHEWPAIAKMLLGEVDKLNLMLRIREGKYRLRGFTSESEQAIDAEVVRELRLYLDDDK